MAFVGLAAVAVLLSYASSLTCAQVTYADGTAALHGITLGRPVSPTATFTLAPGENIVRVFGTYWEVINAIGFATSNNVQYGPWGSGNGFPFDVRGVVTGFFSADTSTYFNLRGVGVYTYLQPGPPPPPLAPGTGRSALYGAGSGSAFDDGASFDG